MKSKIFSVGKFIIGWPLSFLALLFIGKNILSQAPALKSIIHVHGIFLLFSFLCFSLYFGLRGYFWQQLMKLDGKTYGYKQTLFFWSVSELQRYIPGSLWSFIGRTTSFSQKGEKKTLVLSSLLLEAEFLVFGAFFISLFSVNFLVYGLFPSLPFKLFLSIAIPLLVIIGISVFLGGYNFLLHKKQLPQFIQQHIPHFSAAHNFSLFFSMSLALLCFGLGNYFAMSSLVTLYVPHILSLSGFFVFAFLVGYLSIITPMGLGVREAVMTAGLSKYVSLGQAGVAAIFARIFLIISELIFVGVIALLYKVKSTGLDRIWLFIKNHPYSLSLVLLMTTYAAYFTTATFLKYTNYYTGRFDLGNMDQTIWNTLHGRIFQLTNPDSTNIISRFSIHADVILVLLTPFYFIWRDPRMLLLIQTLVLSFGALFVYLIARKLLQHKSLSLAVAFSYLIYPEMNHATLYDFHGITLATTFLLGAFYFSLKKKWVWYILFLILAGTTKEEIWLITGLFGLYSLFVQKKKFLGSIIFVTSITLFYSIVWHVIPLARGGNHFALSYYSDFGSSPTKILGHILFSPLKTTTTVLQNGGLLYLLELFLPIGFLSFFHPFFLIFAGPDLAVNLLSNNKQLHQIYFQYTSAITPFVFISMVYGVRYVLKKWHALTPQLLTWYIAISAIIGAYCIGPLPGSLSFNHAMFTQPLQYRDDIDAFLSSIPRRYSVAATNNLGSHLSRRQLIYTIPLGIDKADVIVFLLNDQYAQPSLKAQIALAEKLRHNPNYTMIYQKNDFVLFVKEGVVLKKPQFKTPSLATSFFW